MVLKQSIRNSMPGGLKINTMLFRIKKKILWWLNPRRGRKCLKVRPSEGEQGLESAELCKT